MEYESMTIEELEEKHHQLDERVAETRGEMQAIHDALEPKRIALQRAKAGPAHLAQSVDTAVKLG